MDLGKFAGLVFIDFKKAFDTVNHNIICKKLKLYGLHHLELSWFKSYLTNRKQFCRVNVVDSEIGEIEFGLPQVFPKFHVLALFSSSSTSMISHKSAQDSNVSMYADDTSLCCQSHDLTRLNETINSDLMKLDTWPQEQAFPECCKNSFCAYFHKAETQ